MIMPTNGNNKESIFPESQWNYSQRAASCKDYYGVDPRPNWISTEFGGHVSIEFSVSMTAFTMIISLKIVSKRITLGHSFVKQNLKIK